MDCAPGIIQMEYPSVPDVQEKIFHQNILHVVFYLAASGTELNIAICVMNIPARNLKALDNSDSFITHKNQLTDFDKVKNIGLDAFKAELNSKVELLKGFLMNFDDGRRKSFFCIAVNLLDLQDLKRVMEQIKDEIRPDEPLKEKSGAAVRLLQTMAEKRDISLELRKKPKL